jgi:hypothetical protein
VEAVDVLSASKGVIIVRMVIEHNNRGFLAVYRIVKIGFASHMQLTNVDDVGDTA